LETRTGKQGVREVYISYLGEDKRLDTWVTYDQIGDKQETPLDAQASLLAVSPFRPKLRATDIQASKVSATVEVQASTGLPQAVQSTPSSPEREHAVVTRVRNFEDVRFGEYLIKTWYYSPYPTIEERSEERAGSPTPISRTNPHKRRKLNGDGEPSIVADLPGASATGQTKYAQLSGHSNGGEKVPSSKVRANQEIFNGSAAKVVEATRGRIWVCDVSLLWLSMSVADVAVVLQVHAKQGYLGSAFSK
jgi:histone acetyltransferase MYST1